MKTKLSLLCRLSCVLCLLALRPAPCALSQIPQGFNYQAIIRDGVTKQPIVSQPVLIRVTIEDGIGTDLYQETHSLSTDEFGIISIIVGQGAPWGTSDFDEIDWNDEPLKLKTEVQYPVGGSYTLMGTAPLMSVPNAMVADSLGGPLKNLTVKGSATAPDTEALFEVKNTTGQTVFAVYNERVRIYVNDQDAKGPKGGFAIGGFGLGKTIPHEYLFISGDSVRVYIDNTDADKGPKGGFAIGGFGTAKTGPQNLLTVSNDSVRIYIDNDDTDKGPKGGFAIGGFGTAKTGPQKFMTISNDSVRIYVDNNTTDKGPKGGFAIGGYGADKSFPQKLLTVSNDSIRIYIDDSSKGPKGGFAIGGFDQGKGEGNNVNFFNVATSADDTIPSQPRILWYPLKNAFLAGQILILTPDSVGLNSVATGFESRAKGAQSQAMGYQAVARGNFSTAIGKNAFAGKDNSFAFGDGVSALRVYSYAFGKGSIARGDYAFALGNIATASGLNSFALGENVTASGSYSYSFGKGSSASNSNAVAMGNTATASGLSSYAFGDGAQATKQYSYAFGKTAKAQGDYSFAMGNTATASGNNSFAIGESVTASFPNSYAFGKNASAAANNAVAMGYYATADGANSFAVNGHASGEYSKALGGTASGDYSLSSGNDVTASGEGAVAMGYDAVASGDFSVAMGRWVRATASQAFSLGMGMNGFPDPTYNEANGTPSFALGQANKANVNGSMTIGVSNISNGLSSVLIGTRNSASAAFSTVIGCLGSATGDAYAWNLTEPLFVIGNGDPNGSTYSNAVTVLKNGYFGIGTLPSYTFEVSASASDSYAGQFKNSAGTTTSHGIRIGAGNSATGGAYFVAFMRPSGKGFYTHIGSISQNGADAVAYNTTSDARVKKNITETLFGISELMQVKVRDFQFKEDPAARRNTGFIAQELYEVYPLAVTKPDDSKNLWQVDYGRITPLIVKAVQDQQNEIESLRKTISKLEALVEKLMEE